MEWQDAHDYELHDYELYEEPDFGLDGDSDDDSQFGPSDSEGHLADVRLHSADPVEGAEAAEVEAKSTLLREIRAATYQEVLVSQATRSGRSCNEVYLKAQRILTYVHAIPRSIGSPAREALATAIQVFNWSLQGQLAYRQIGNALSLLTLASCLQSGELWTVTDQSDFHLLCTGDLRSGWSLEEQSSEAQTVTPNSTFFQAQVLSHSPIFQGDMAIENEAAAATGLPIIATKLWESSGTSTGTIIHYCYADNLLRPEVSDVYAAMELAIAEVSDQLPCLRFQLGPVDSGGSVCLGGKRGRVVVPSFLVTSAYEGCWSHYGRVSGNSNYRVLSQILNLGRGCALKGMALHQLSHTLGIGHLITRVDRDQYLAMSNASRNVTNKSLADYFPFNNAESDDTPLDEPFDFLSLMMPSSYSLPVGHVGYPSIIVSNPHAYALHNYLGQRISLTEGDINRLSRAYSCGMRKLVNTPTEHLAAALENWTIDRMEFASLGPGLQLNGSCVNSNASCDELQHRCWELMLGGQIRQACRQSCLMCINASDVVVRDFQAYLQETGASVEDVQAVTPTRDEQSYAVRRCVDREITGIVFADGEEATCQQLRNYCHHQTMGRRVNLTCAKSCGNCFMYKSGQPESPSPAVPTCSDQPGSAAPRFMIGGVDQECADLIDFCSGHIDSDFVAEKCQETCKVCEGGVKARVRGALDMNPECSRRRRWGFCHSRRRRDDQGDVSYEP